MNTNEQITERVMRMGVEHRNGVPLDKLHDLAAKQLNEVKPNVAQQIASFEDWKAQSNQFAFMNVNDKLQIVRVKDPSTVLFVSWPTYRPYPEVKLK